MAHTPHPTLAALSDRDLALVTLYGEASGEPIEGQIAVMQCFDHRVKSGRWGDSLHDTLLAWAQFSCLWAELGGPNFARVLAYATASPRFPADLTTQLEWVVDGVLEGKVKDTISGALHYYATYIPPPSWAVSPAKAVAQKGKHIFWAGVK
jgi:N-acetylmuramoyl-L-alanine amidase